MQVLIWWRPAGARLPIHVQIRNRKKRPSVCRLGRLFVAWWRRGRVELGLKHELAVSLAAIGIEKYLIIDRQS